jgi:hypothetical protein
MIQLKGYEINLNGIQGVSKSPGIWGHVKGENMTIPLMFLKKPKWMVQEDFNMIVKSIQIYIPGNFQFREKV